MNLLTLILKQARQRALSTTLTLLSVVLGVALAVATLALQRGGERLLGQAEYGYDLLVGPQRGSNLNLVLNTVYGLGQAQGTLPYATVDYLRERDQAQLVRWAVPFMVGDFYKGKRILCAPPSLFGYADDGATKLEPGRAFQYRPDRPLTFAEGRPYVGDRFEAVLGAKAAEATNTKLGGEVWLEHAGKADDVHAERWRVVGVLARTGTALDDAVFVPLVTGWAIPEHGEGMEQISALAGDAAPTTREAHDDHDHDHDHGSTGEFGTDHAGHDHGTYTLSPDGRVQLTLKPEQLRVSGIFVRSRGGYQTQVLSYRINNGGRGSAVSVAGEMRGFFATFFAPVGWVLLGLAGLVTTVAAVSILVSIYNATAARLREVAILRALGATRARVLALVVGEATLVGAAGAALGWVAGRAVAGAASAALARRLGQGFDWWRPDAREGAFLAAVVVLAAVAGLVPALKAYRAPVADGLAG